MSKFYVVCILCITFAASVAAGIKGEVKPQGKMKPVNYKTRCTRRFTPGTCREPVNSVWYFDFQIMNCTERLGCPQSYRTNRFRSFEGCMSRCRLLVDLYLQILTYAAENDTSYVLRKIPSASRFQDLLRTASSLPTPPFDDQSAESEDVYPGDEAVLTRDMYLHRHDEDIDAVPRIKNPEDYFDFHL